MVFTLWIYATSCCQVTLETAKLGGSVACKQSYMRGEIQRVNILFQVIHSVLNQSEQSDISLIKQSKFYLLML